MRGAIRTWRFVITVARRRRRRSACLIFSRKNKNDIFSKMRVTDSIFRCRDSSSSLVTQGPRRHKRAGVDPSRHIFPRISSSIAGKRGVRFLIPAHHRQCAKQPACLGLNTERPVHRTSPALFMPWSDAPGLSAHTLVVRSVGQEDGSPQWGVVHEHTRRPTPVFMNTKQINSNFHRPTWACGGRPPQHLNNTRQLPSTGRSMVGRCSTAKADFGLLTPNFPLFMNKQRRLLCALAQALCRKNLDFSPRRSADTRQTRGAKPSKRRRILLGPLPRGPQPSAHGPPC